MPFSEEDKHTFSPVRITRGGHCFFRQTVINDRKYFYGCVIEPRNNLILLLALLNDSIHDHSNHR